MARSSFALAALILLSACRGEAPVVLRAEPTGAAAETVAAARAVTLPAMLERDGRVVVEPARRGAMGDMVSAPCEVVASPDGAAQVATTVLARVVAWHVAPGDVVRAGAPVVTLDAPDVALHRTELARAAVDVRDFERRVREETAMLAQGATSARAERESQTLLARAREAVAAARRALSVAQATDGGAGGAFTLRSPLAGVVTAREGMRGAVVEPPAVLVTVVDLGALRVAVNLPEQSSDAPVGTPATVTLRGHGGTLAGRVVWRAPEVQRATRTRAVHLALGAGAQGIAPGETGTARIERGAREAVLVPATAVFREGDRATVFVREAEGRYAARAVVTGREAGGAVEIVAGLDAGAPVVVRGTFLVAAERARLQGGGA